MPVWKNCDFSRGFVCNYITTPFAREDSRQSVLVGTPSRYDNSVRNQRVNHRRKGSGYSIFDNLNTIVSDDINCRGSRNNFISKSGFIC